MSVRAGTLSPRPLMELTYKVAIARITTQTRTAGKVTPVDTWSQLQATVVCDVAPLRDDLRFAQAGADVIATHVIHFFARTDIREKDRIKVLTNRRLAGPINSWYEIVTRLEPAETLAYVKCFALLTDKPPGFA